MAKNNRAQTDLWKSIGGAEQNRTVDLLNAIQALSQLSYDPIQWFRAVRQDGVGHRRSHEGWIDAGHRSVKRNALGQSGKSAALAFLASMPLAAIAAGKNVESFNRTGKGHGDIDVFARNVEMRAVRDQRHADQ